MAVYDAVPKASAMVLFPLCRFFVSTFLDNYTNLYIKKETAPLKIYNGEGNLCAISISGMAGPQAIQYVYPELTFATSHISKHYNYGLFLCLECTH